MNYKALTNEELVSKTERTIQVERESTAEVIRLFEEIHSRKLYLKHGFPSLFEMATKYFGYCAASAMRRINAMRLVRDVPEAFEKIESGELSLSVVNELQTYFQQEAKAERAYSIGAKIELLERSLGKSRREVEQEIANRNPERSKPETIHAISNDRSRINISVSNDLLKKMNHLRDLRSHVNPNMTIEDLLTELVELGLDKRDPVRKEERTQAKRAKHEHDREREHERQLPPAEVKRSRYIPMQERPKREPCCAIDETTGRRCNSTRFLQLDHIQPFSQGGPSTAENLRWLCGEHNRARP